MTTPEGPQRITILGEAGGFFTSALGLLATAADPGAEPVLIGLMAGGLRLCSVELARASTPELIDHVGTLARALAADAAYFVSIAPTAISTEGAARIFLAEAVLADGARRRVVISGVDGGGSALYGPADAGGGDETRGPLDAQAFARSHLVASPGAAVEAADAVRAIAELRALGARVVVSLASLTWCLGPEAPDVPSRFRPERNRRRRGAWRERLRGCGALRGPGLGADPRHDRTRGAVATPDRAAAPW